ncbi:MAG TPA: chromosome partitioning protein ParB [Oribacterium sp.]|nr:chromosome partitioning protein ParB [Oribacterium sp.]
METVQDTEDGMMLVKLSRIQPDHDQPRKNFDEEKLQELADSIRTYGVISPIVVKKRGAFYEIVAGERRWRAARIAGLKEIPVVVKEVDEKTSRELAIIENIQRDDLNAVEEARAYQSLIEEYGLTQEEVAARVAKNRSTITNSLRLLKLDPEILQLLQEEKITQGHARALLSVEDPELRKKIAEKCTNENLSVREIETLVKLDRLSKEKKERKSSPEAQELRRLKVIYRDLEKKMKTKLGTKVSIVPKNTERGTLEIEYYSQDDLDRIFMILNSSHQN